MKSGGEPSKGTKLRLIVRRELDFVLKSVRKSTKVRAVTFRLLRVINLEAWVPLLFEHKDLLSLGILLHRNAETEKSEILRIVDYYWLLVSSINFKIRL